MRRFFPKALLVLAALALVLPASGVRAEMPEPPEAITDNHRATLDPGAKLSVGDARTMSLDGNDYRLRGLEGHHAGAFIPDGEGGYIRLDNGRAVGAPDPAAENARELRLKVRELGEQLMANARPGSLVNQVAMPLSFVHQDDFAQSSSFGRYLAEQMFHEFSVRGVAVREYRMGQDIMFRKQRGDFLLFRGMQNLYAQNPDTLYLVGTYYFDLDSIFVNARLIRAVDGMVVSSGLTRLGVTPLTKRMLANAGMQLQASYYGVKDYETLNRAFDLTDIDLGDDVH